MHQIWYAVGAFPDLFLRYVRKDHDLFVSLELKRRGTTCREKYLDLRRSPIL
jgi:hypothetical protein